MQNVLAEQLDMYGVEDVGPYAEYLQSMLEDADPLADEHSARDALSQVVEFIDELLEGGAPSSLEDQLWSAWCECAVSAPPASVAASAQACSAAASAQACSVSACVAADTSAASTSPSTFAATPASTTAHAADTTTTTATAARAAAERGKVADLASDGVEQSKLRQRTLMLAQRSDRGGATEVALVDNHRAVLEAARAESSKAYTHRQSLHRAQRSERQERAAQEELKRLKRLNLTGGSKLQVEAVKQAERRGHVTACREMSDRRKQYAEGVRGGGAKDGADRQAKGSGGGSVRR
jgi:hypothetical protein